MVYQSFQSPLFIVHFRCLSMSLTDLSFLISSQSIDFFKSDQVGDDKVPCQRWLEDVKLFSVEISIVNYICTQTQKQRLRRNSAGHVWTYLRTTKVNFATRAAAAAAAAAASGVNKSVDILIRFQRDVWVERRRENEQQVNKWSDRKNYKLGRKYDNWVYACNSVGRYYNTQYLD